MKHLLITSFLAVVFSLNSWSQCMHVSSENGFFSEGISRVVEAKVIGQQAVFNSVGNIITLNELEVYKEFGHDITEISISVVTEGGVVGEMAQVVYPSVSLAQGSIVLCSLVEKNGQLMANQAYQYNKISATYATPFGDVSAENMYKEIGVITGSETFQSRKELPAFEVDARMAPPQIASYSPSVISAGTLEELTITGAGFGSSQGDGCVSFSNANNGGQSYVTLPNGPHYVYWSDTEVRVLVPSSMLFENVVAGSGNVGVTNHNGGQTDSAQPLTITYAQGEVVYQGQLGQTSLIGVENGGYRFKLGSNLSALAGGPSLVSSAMEKWACNTGVNFYLDDNTTVPEQYEVDGINVIGMASPGLLPNNVLGKTVTTFSGCGGGQGVEWQLVEVDILFNPNMNWYVGNGIPPQQSFDLLTVMLHELGHAHLIQHNNDENSVMYFELNEHATRRYIDQGTDLLGGSMIVDRSINFAPTCSNSSMSFYSDVDCNMSVVNSVDDAEASFSLSPNPTIGGIQLKSGKAFNQWELRDLSGRSVPVNVYSNSNFELTLNLSTLPKGVYILNVSGADFNLSEKVVLQ